MVGVLRVRARELSKTKQEWLQTQVSMLIYTAENTDTLPLPGQFMWNQSNAFPSQQLVQSQPFLAQAPIQSNPFQSTADIHFRPQQHRAIHCKLRLQNSRSVLYPHRLQSREMMKMMTTLLSRTFLVLL